MSKTMLRCRMRTAHKHKRVAFLLNSLSVILVATGIINFFFFGRNYQHSQLYLIAAIAILTVTAIISKLGRAGSVRPVEPVSDQNRERVPAWMYGFIALCIIFALINSFTSVFRSVIAAACVAALLMAGIATIIYRRSRSYPKKKLNRIQRLGLALAVVILLVDLVQLAVLIEQPPAATVSTLARPSPGRGGI